MTANMQTAALAGVPSGIQSSGVWAGRRQLFIRFAGEAETATMYTSGALVLAPRDETPDPVMLRVIERASAVSKETAIIIHPSPAAVERGGTLERRWASLLETTSSLHANVRLILRVPPPAGLR